MELPARLGKYRLEEFLGGGMSHVYRAQDTVIGRTVAVKILTPTGSWDPEAKERFLAEARMAGNIAHENVITIYDFGEDEQHGLFMVMEFLRGEDLRHAIKNGHTGDLTSKLKIALPVARALQYIHGLKIIHRDIKPENVYITAAGVVKLMDFGIAKAEGLSMTRSGMVLGTPTYMAPEQVNGKEITEQVDVYAFGLLLFELLSGLKPVSGDSMERVFYSILKEPLNLDPLKQAGVPREVCDLILKCTAKEPTARPPGFSPIMTEMEGIIAGLDSPTTEIRSPAGLLSRRRWLLSAAAAVVLLVSVGLFFALHHTKHGSEMPKTISTSTGEMVLVPAGGFEFGEKKEHLTLGAFYIDKTEVTNAAYAQFCNSTKRRTPENFALDKPRYPVVNVTILDARDFANWAGKRLPNSHEWEKAARGADGRPYPWGNYQDNSRANVGGTELQPAEAYPNGASPCGALQMVGNVWELVEQLSVPGPKALGFFKKALKPPPTAGEPWYMIRGESFHDVVVSPDVVWDSTIVPVRWKDLNIGFRCVKDAP
jgi:formylglycine-generating enzyme required for sulfatase activity